MAKARYARIHGKIKRFKPTKAFGTHFVDEGALLYVFNVDNCETCGRALEAPNPVKLAHNRDEAIEWGMIELPRRLDELCYDPESDTGTCPNCYHRAADVAKIAGAITNARTIGENTNEWARETCRVNGIKITMAILEEAYIEANKD